MEFCEYAKMLYPICGDGATRYDFVIRLIGNIVENEATDGCEVLEYSKDYAGRVYSGAKNITPAQATYINGHIDKPKYESYICSFSESARESIVSALIKNRIRADVRNVHEVCTDTLVQILLDIAAGENSKKPSTVQADASAMLYGKYGFRLLMEAGSICPNDGCVEPLYFQKNGKAEPKYVLTVIDPEGSPEDASNLIALCPKCSDYYSQSPSPEEIKRMQIIKQEIVRQEESREVAADIKIETGIRIVLQRIAEADDSALIKLNYTPQMVIDKITEDNKALRRKVLGYVISYFKFTTGVFQELDVEGKLRFDKVAAQIRNCYVSENDKGRSQPEIFDALVNWLMGMTHEERTPCEAVIAYFVQSCEVFDAIAK